MNPVIRVGDRVCGGEPGTEDYDEGTVHEIDGDQAEVAWDSQVRTTQAASLLTVIEVAS